MSSQQKNIEEAIEKAKRLLVEHADAVVILALYTDNGEDKCYTAGSGSSYAQHGMVEEQFLKWREYVKTHARHMQNKEYPNDEPEDE